MLPGRDSSHPNAELQIKAGAYFTPLPVSEFSSAGGNDIQGLTRYPH